MLTIGTFAVCWAVGSMGIAVAVGVLVSMFFLRRKFRGLYYLLCGCCPCVSRGRSAAKRSKSLRSKAASTSSTSRSSSTNSEDDEDRGVEMKRYGLCIRLLDVSTPDVSCLADSLATAPPRRPPKSTTHRSSSTGSAFKSSMCTRSSSLPAMSVVSDLALLLWIVPEPLKSQRLRRRPGLAHRCIPHL